MGRPLNKRLFGNSAIPGMQLRCTVYWKGNGSSVDAFIIKQLSSTRFLVSDPSGKEGICTLWPKIPNNLDTYVPSTSDLGTVGIAAAQLVDNTVVITALPYRYTVGTDFSSHVAKLSSRRITIKTWHGLYEESAYVADKMNMVNNVLLGPNGPGEYLLRCN